MRRWLKAVKIKIPKTFLELQQLSEKDENWKKLLTCPKGSIDVKYEAIADDGTKVIVFGNPEFIQKFKDKKVLFADATYGSRPRIRSIYQFLTFMVEFMDYVSILFKQI